MTNRPPSDPYFFAADLQNVQKNIVVNMCKLSFPPLSLGTSVNLLCENQEGPKHSVYTLKQSPHLSVKHHLMDYFEPSDFLSLFAAPDCELGVYLWYKSRLNNYSRPFQGNYNFYFLLMMQEMKCLKEKSHFYYISKS